MQNDKGSSESDELLSQVQTVAQKEAKRTKDDIYREVVFDEVNQELMKAVQKAEGETIVLLLRQERIKSFTDLWKTTNMDYY